MHYGIHTVLMVLAIICFLLSAFGVKTWKADDFTAIGLALWALAVVIGSA